MALLDITGNTTIYPLKGFIVGNGATNWNYDADAAYPETFYNLNIISQDLFEQFKANNCLYYWGDVKVANNSDKCKDLRNQMINDT
jgi:predicted phage gp36 major capsid-like protein